MSDRLYRSRDDRMLAGVAGGLARMLDADPSVIRIAWVVVTILSGGIALIVYLIMAVVVPEAPDDLVWAAPAPAAPSGPVPADGWMAPDGRIVQRADARTAPASGQPALHRHGDGRRLAVAVGVILVVLGGLFLVREFAPTVDLSSAWPVASIGFGVLLLILSVRPRRA